MELIGTYLSGDARKQFDKWSGRHDKFYAAFCQVRWTLKDIKSGTILFEEEITGGYYFGKMSYVKEYEDQNYSARKAVVSSMQELLRNNEFLEAAQRKIDPIELEFEEQFSIPAPLEYVNSLDKSLEATVTIQTPLGFGSGFFISEAGFILTNSHVITDSEEYTVVLSTGLSIKAVLIRENSEMDVALLRIPVEGLPTFNLVKESSLKIGDEIFAIGTPKSVDLGQTLTKGIVSGFRGKERKFIQSDVSINQGNSGGPMLNSQYQVVGVVTSKIIGHGTEGLGFAIPIEDAMKSLNINIHE